MTEPIQITVDRLYAKIGLLVIENEVLREQLANAQQEQPAENATRSGTPE